MPPIKLDHVVSFSSEDKVYKAENLLKSDTYRKWKCATAGEKQASVVLQLEKATQIQSIDIGNEGSAFIEVLVTRSSEAKDDYQVLLVASSFMTPIESRQNSNLNKVRMFGPDSLSQTAAKEKWDRVKVVCTQPFNKNIQYGISFITLNSQPNSSEVTSPKTPMKQTILGHFKLKDADDEDNVQVGSWFARHQEKKSEDPLMGPAAIRRASSSIETLPSSSKEKQKVPAINFNKKKKDQTEDDGKNKLTKETKTGNETPSKRKLEEHDLQTLPNKRQKDNQPSFNTLLKDVVFVISGFQNPLRSEIRDKALEMGAKYKADWNAVCTHLICAFMNTPKYQQVMTKGGKIVTKDWILDCHKKRSRLSWKRYQLDKSKDDESSSESEPEAPVQPSAKAKKIKPSPETSKKDSAKQSKGPVMSDDDIFDADTDVGSPSECDTEDELMKAQNIIRAAKNKPSNERKEFTKKQDTTQLPLPSLPNIFKGKHFFFYGKAVIAHKHSLQRYILGCSGVIEDYMSDTVNCVITDENWNENFDDALAENEDVIFLKPGWILKCIKEGKILPYGAFEITRSS